MSNVKLEQIRDNKLAKCGSFILAMILPIVGICLLTSPIDSGLSDISLDIIYHVLWCGFYGSILCAIMFKNLYIRLLVILPNLALIVTIICFSAMGGIGGSGIALLKTIIPFIPWFSMLG